MEHDLPVNQLFMHGSQLCDKSKRKYFVVVVTGTESAQYI